MPELEKSDWNRQRCSDFGGHLMLYEHVHVLRTEYSFPSPVVKGNLWKEENAPDLVWNGMVNSEETPLWETSGQIETKGKEETLKTSSTFLIKSYKAPFKVGHGVRSIWPGHHCGTRGSRQDHRPGSRLPPCLPHGASHFQGLVGARSPAP